MPNESQHINWAIHSYDVIEYIAERPLFCDWMATMIFYSALHIIDGVLFRQEHNTRNRHGVDHNKRRGILRRANKYKTLYMNYQKLYEHSQIARYLKPRHGRTMFFQQYMTHKEVIAIALGKQLMAIVNAAMVLVSTDSKQELKIMASRINKLAKRTRTQ